MNKNISCTKILLAKNEAGSAGYCESCDVVELGIGAISIRIVATDLYYIAQLLKVADTNMAHYHLAKDCEQHQSVQSTEVVH